MTCPHCNSIDTREYSSIEPFTPRSLGGDVVVFANHYYTKCESCGAEYVTASQAKLNEENLQKAIDKTPR